MCDSVLYRSMHATKEKPTIKQFINKNKIILDVFLCQFSKVRLHNFHHFEEELKNHSSIDILSCDCSYPNITTFCVKETSACNVCHGRTHKATCMDNIYTKCINTIASNERMITVKQKAQYMYTTFNNST